MGGGVGDASFPRSVVAMASIVRGRQERRHRNAKQKRCNNDSSRSRAEVWVATERGTPLVTPPREVGGGAVCSPGHRQGAGRPVRPLGTVRNPADPVSS